jgi:hypothetical protein
MIHTSVDGWTTAHTTVRLFSACSSTSAVLHGRCRRAATGKHDTAREYMI